MSPGVQLSARSGDGSFGHEAIELLKTPSPTTSGLKAAPALPHKARWLTPEFLVYIGFLAFCFWQGIGLVWEISNSTRRRLTAIASCSPVAVPRCALETLSLAEFCE